MPHSYVKWKKYVWIKISFSSSYSRICLSISFSRESRFVTLAQKWLLSNCKTFKTGVSSARDCLRHRRPNRHQLGTWTARIFQRKRKPGFSVRNLAVAHRGSQSWTWSRHSGDLSSGPDKTFFRYKGMERAQGTTSWRRRLVCLERELDVHPIAELHRWDDAEEDERQAGGAAMFGQTWRRCQVRKLLVKPLIEIR